MKFAEIVKMYIDWSYDCDETIHQSDIISACYEAGIDYKMVVEVGDEEGKKRFGY